jgi:hypothetical protein
MNIQTVIDNLDRTIRGKEMLRGELARRTVRISHRRGAKAAPTLYGKCN